MTSPLGASTKIEYDALLAFPNCTHASTIALAVSALSKQSDDRNHQSELWSFRIAREVTRESGEVMRLSCEVIRESCEVTRESFGAFIVPFQRRVLGPITAG